jgi:hypothetical protein
MWSTLTALPDKARWYESEAFFRESLADFRLVLGSELDYHVQRTAILTIRPDGIAGRRIEAVVRFLTENGFRIIHVECLRYTPILVRELWRYQLNRATLDRIMLLDLLCGQSPGLVLVLQDDVGRSDVPATVRLWSLKGSAVPEWRDGSTLRDVLSVPNRVLTMVHATDEPIDLLREMGVLLSTHRRLEWATLFARTDHDRDAGAEKALSMARSLYTSSAASDFDLAAVRARMRAAIADNGAESTPADPRARLLRDLFPVSAGAVFPLRAWLLTAGNVLESFDPWDVITAASFSIEHNLPGAASLIPGNAPEGWYDGKARRASHPVR